MHNMIVFVYCIKYTVTLRFGILYSVNLYMTNLHMSYFMNNFKRVGRTISQISRFRLDEIISRGLT